MQQVTLPGTDLKMSKFIFGTASLFNAGSRDKRLALLEAVIDSGITHFDTAPYYGFGMAERDMGAVLPRYPHVTVTTKVGIRSPGGERQPWATIFARKAAGRFLKPISAPTIDFSLGYARTALEDSLRRLKREQIEIYMLHEPELHLVKTDEWRRWLEDVQKAGKVRTFGLALTADRLEPFLEAKTGLDPVIQVLDSLKDREADLLPRHGRPLQITYGYVSAARKTGDQTPVGEILAQAVARNPEGAIIVSTRQPGRLSQYSDILARAKAAA
jgi:aryl-alcohol dehydrogenase-like predicted oxidoreductase